MSQRNESMPFHPFQNMFQTYFGGLDTAAQSFEPMVKGMARWQLETMGLMSRRAQAYLEIPARLSQCRTPQDLFNEQTRFFQTAMQQYTESSRKLTAALSQMASVPPVFGQATQTRVKRDYITIPEPKAASSTPKPVIARERRVA